MKIESFLPLFTGFYHTVFDYDSEDQDIEYYNEQNQTNYTYDDFTFNYSEYRQRVSKSCCLAIESLLESELDLTIKVKFQHLVSPREYNFATDSINVEFELTSKEYKRLIHLLLENKLDFENFLETNYTACSGFIPRYSTDVDEWLNDYLSPNSDEISHCFGKVLEFLFLNIGVDDCNLYDHDELNDDRHYIEFELNEN